MTLINGLHEMLEDCGVELYPHTVAFSIALHSSLFVFGVIIIHNSNFHLTLTKVA